MIRSACTFPFTLVVKRSRLTLFLISGYLWSTLVLVMLTKITLNRYFMYAAFLGPIPLLGAVFAINGYRWKRSSLNKWVLAFFLISLLEILNPNTSIIAGITYFASKYSAILMYPISILGITSEKAVVSIMKTLALGAALGALYTIYQEFIGYPQFEDAWAYSMGNVHGLDIFVGLLHRRPPGLVIYSAFNAVLLAMTAIMTTPIYLCRRRGWLLALVYLSVLGAAVFLTLTRGVWVGFVLGLAYLFWSVFRRYKELRQRIILTTLMVSVALVILISFNAFLVERLASFRYMFYAKTAFMARVYGWKTIFTEYREGLFFGHGTGSIGVGGSSIEGASVRRMNLADNMYFNILFSSGILGLIPFCAILWKAYRIHLYNYKNLSSPSLRLISLGLISGLLAYAVFFFTGDYLEAFPANLYFWSALGILSTIRYLDRSAADASMRAALAQAQP